MSIRTEEFVFFVFDFFSTDTADGTDLMLLQFDHHDPFLPPVINPPQFVIDDLFDINSVYIDSFQKIMNYYAPTYGEDPFWLSDNNNLEKFFLDRGYIFEKKGKFTYFAVTCKQFFRFEYLLVRKKLSKNKCLKALRNIIYRGC